MVVSIGSGRAPAGAAVTSDRRLANFWDRAASLMIASWRKFWKQTVWSVLIITACMLAWKCLPNGYD